MPRIPPWLALLLTPVVFFGSCTASLLPVWHWLDARATHPVKGDERHLVPLLAVTRSGQYVVTGQHNEDDLIVVTTFRREDERRINQQLTDPIGIKDYCYPWFQVLEEKDGVMRVSLEAPTGKESKRKGWYTVDHGTIIPERIVHYGPGFAYAVMPWTFAAGVVGVVIYLIILAVLNRPPPINPAISPD